MSDHPNQPTSCELEQNDDGQFLQDGEWIDRDLLSVATLQKMYDGGIPLYPTETGRLFAGNPDDIANPDTPIDPNVVTEGP